MNRVVATTAKPRQRRARAKRAPGQGVAASANPLALAVPPRAIAAMAQAMGQKRPTKAKRPRGESFIPALAMVSQLPFVVLLSLPIRTKSELNGSREHYGAITKRKRAQKATTALVCNTVDRDAKSRLVLPMAITMTRVGPRKLDTDNNAISMKYVRDQLAAWLGHDDGIDEIEWRYLREVGPRYGVRVEIQPC